MICRICENAKDNKPFKVREMMFGYREWFLYFQCSQCGCLQIAEIPADVSQYYPSAYYSYTVSPEVKSANPVRRFLKKRRDHYALYNRGVAGRFFYWKLPNETLRSLSRIDDLRKDSKILDVGCGSGILLYELKQLGFKNLLGVDSYIKKNIEYKNGVKIIKKDIREIAGEWEVIMFHHSFEHLPDPLEVLQCAAKLLSREGICLIRTPTVSSFAWEHYGVNWVQLDAPRHFFIHSIESVEFIAKKATLELEKVVYDSTDFQFWGSEQYLRDIPFMSERSYFINRSRSIFSVLDIARFKKKAKRLNRENRGDSAIFHLRKAL